MPPSPYIVPEAQGAGVGTLLIQQLIDEAQKTDNALTLGTAKINPALRLYTRLGFRPEREDEYKVYLRYATRYTPSG